MLEIRNISKTYVTGALTQRALDDVSLTLRDSEFVAVLGPSGSGKTTLLNVIGGLDRFDSGDLVIDGRSTKDYKERDWDSYRNHTIGFVFQSYNLIMHQSVLANVELALTISGVSRKERRQRAQQALEEVGLGDQGHKRPNQLSGGQMQRVAIARALVNNPQILLADEPTGALDTTTGIQVMELLREVAKSRLVVMVTHNPELAQQYATRIIRLRDGKVQGDTDPIAADGAHTAHYARPPRTSMSFATALSLSANNLRTKKARTVLTAFAGSIGIIGIALILSLSNGVSTYIDDVQKEAMSSYPITIDSETMDLMSLAESGREQRMEQLNGSNSADDSGNGSGAIYASGSMIELASTVATDLISNNLSAFKQYLDDESSEIHQYLGEGGIVCSYDVSYDIYTYDEDGVLLNTDGSTLNDFESDSTIGQVSAMGSMFYDVSSNFEELMPGSGTELVSSIVTDSYEVLAGSWPQSYDEVVLIVDSNDEIDASVLYSLGLLPSADYREMMEEINEGESIEVADVRLEYDEVLGHTFYLVPACDRYVQRENGTWQEAEEGSAQMQQIIDEAQPLVISGIVRAGDDAASSALSPSTAAVGYTNALTMHIIDYTNESAVVQAQTADSATDVLTGLPFAQGSTTSSDGSGGEAGDSDGSGDSAADAREAVTESAADTDTKNAETAQNTSANSESGRLSDDEQKAEAVRSFLSGLSDAEKNEMMSEYLSQMSGGAGSLLSQFGTRSDEEAAAMFDTYIGSADTQMLVSLYDQYLSGGSYEANLASFGVVDVDTPSSIALYADSFEDKDRIADCIADYNAQADPEDQIVYVDYVALLMSSVTTIINTISYVLIAFVAVSLVVSSIMIGIITYISVLERTKEIGVLRALGASRRNISQVFNAETFIIGLLAGVMGIAVTVLLLIPGNMLIHSISGNADVSAVLPLRAALILIALSIVLTLIGGLIPSRKAARMDPVAALRTE